MACTPSRWPCLPAPRAPPWRKSRGRSSAAREIKLPPGAGYPRQARSRRRPARRSDVTPDRPAARAPGAARAAPPAILAEYAALAEPAHSGVLGRARSRCGAVAGRPRTPFAALRRTCCAEGSGCAATGLLGCEAAGGSGAWRWTPASGWSFCTVPAVHDDFMDRDDGPPGRPRPCTPLGGRPARAPGSEPRVLLDRGSARPGAGAGAREQRSRRSGTAAAGRLLAQACRKSRSGRCRTCPPARARLAARRCSPSSR